MLDPQKRLRDVTDFVIHCCMNGSFLVFFENFKLNIIDVHVYKPTIIYSIIYTAFVFTDVSPRLVLQAKEIAVDFFFYFEAWLQTDLRSNSILPRFLSVVTRVFLPIVLPKNLTTLNHLAFWFNYGARSTRRHNDRGISTQQFDRYLVQ